MTMLDYLEADKERIFSRLTEHNTPEKALSVIGDELDRLLLLYNERCVDPKIRESAAIMMQTAKMTAPLVNTAGEIRVWENTSGADHSPKTATLGEKAFRILAIVTAACGFALALKQGPDTYSIAEIVLSFILLAISVFLSWSWGMASGKRNYSRSKNYPVTYHTELLIDSEAVYRVLHHMAYTVDQELERILGEKETVTAQNPDSLSDAKDQLKLFGDLLEAAYSKDGDFALERTAQVRHYLHGTGIEVQDYNGSNQEMFDFLPSKRNATIRPALVSDGNLLLKGLAAGEK